MKQGECMWKLIKYEWMKNFTKKSIWIAVIIFCLIDLWKINSIYMEKSYLAGESGYEWNKVFWSLYEKYEGEMTREKIEDILKIYRPLEIAVSDMTANKDMNNPNTMTGNEYSDYNLLDRYFITPMEYFYNYKNDANKVVLQAKENVKFYKSKGNGYESKKNAVIYHLFENRVITNFAYLEMYNYYFNYNFSNVLILLLCLYGIVGVFGCEKTAMMQGLLLTNKNGGKKTMLAKMFATSLYAISISLILSVVDYIGFMATFRTVEGGTLPIYSISVFSSASLNVSIIKYVVVSVCTKILGFWLLGMILLLVSQICQNGMIAFVIGLVVSMLLATISAHYNYLSNVWLKVINPYSLLENRYLYGKTEFVNLFGTPFFSYQAALVVAFSLGALILFMMICNTHSNYHCKGRSNYV